MKSPKEQRMNLTDEELTDLAQDLILALLKSADTEVIKPKVWWERAKTALETGANAAHSFQHMVSRCGNKLQLLAPLAVTSKTISSISSKLNDEILFERFRYICQRDAIYIIAMARVKREDEKALWEEDKTRRNKAQKIKEKQDAKD
jgi:hypothetical protein